MKIVTATKNSQKLKEVGFKQNVSVLLLFNLNKYKLCLAFTYTTV